MRPGKPPLVRAARRGVLHCAVWGLCLLASAPAGAIDLLQAYQSALEHDPTLLASRSTLDAVRERIAQARSQLGPNASANVGRTANVLRSTSPNLFGQSQTSNSRYISGSAGVTVRQPLYRPYGPAQVRQAEAQAADASANVDKESQTLGVRVVTAYFDALLADDQLKLVLGQRASYLTQLDAARKAFRAGSGTRTEIDEAQARVDFSQALELEAQQNFDDSRTRLQTLVHQPVDDITPLSVERLVLESSEADSLQAWVSRAENESPEIRSVRAQIDAARQEIEKAKTGRLPTLDATLQASRSESEYVSSLGSRYDNRSIGVLLTIPLYDGGYVDAGVRQATAEQSRLEHLLDALRNDLSQRLTREHRGVADGVLRVRALEQAVRSAEQLVVSSRKAFRAGSRTRLDILNAEQQRLQLLRDLAKARYDYLLARVRLRSLTGADQVEVIAEVNGWLGAPEAAPLRFEWGCLGCLTRSP